MSKDAKDAPYSDVSKQAEQAKKDAEKPAEFDDDGRLKRDGKVSQSTVELADEVSRRASGAANGGGPWPEEVLRKNFVDPRESTARPEPEYTSHETS